MPAPTGPLISPKEPKPQVGKLSFPAQKKGESKQKFMAPADIIIKSVEKENPGSDGRKYAAAVGYMERDKKARTVQIGNTVFIIMPPNGPQVELHIASVEPPNEIVQRLKVLPNTLKQLGIKKVLTYSDNPAMKKLATQTGLPVKMSQTQRMVGNQMKPTYQFEMDL